MSFKRLQPSLTKLDTAGADSPNDGPSSAFSAGSVKRNAVYIVINEYTKRMQDELDMKPGDKIQVITDDEEYNDGWYYGRNLRTNEEGLFPVIFTQEMTFNAKPGLIRAKSNRRVGSAGKGNSSVSVNGSGSEISTPQAVETAAPIMVEQKKKPVDRKISVKSTMSDIDRALEELKNSSFEDQSVPTTEVNGKRDTVMSSTRHLNFGRGTDFSGIPKSVSKDTNAATSSINGIDTAELDPTRAESWTPQQVTAYFISQGFDVQSASRFQQHRISGAILLELELAHLKELEISSFGTRFEIYKEIEALREQVHVSSKRHVTQPRPKSMFGAPDTAPSDTALTTDADNASDKSKGLTPPVFLNGGPTYRGHVKKTSQSLDDIQNTFEEQTNNDDVKLPKHKPTSFGNEFDSAVSSSPINGSGVGDLELFSSPRRAPKPPSYPSPVAPPRSPIGNMTVAHSGVGYSPPTIYEKNTSSVESNYSDSVNKGADSVNAAQEDSRALPGSLDGNSTSLSGRGDMFAAGPKFSFPSEERIQRKSFPNDTSRMGLGLAMDTPGPVNSPRSEDYWSNLDPYSIRKSVSGNDNNHNNSYNNNSNSGNNPGLAPTGAHKNSLSGASFMDLLNKVSHKNPSFEDVDEKKFSDYVDESLGRPTSSVYNSHSRNPSLVKGPSVPGASEYYDPKRDSGPLSYFSAKEDDDASSTPVNPPTGVFPSKGKGVNNYRSSALPKQAVDENSQMTPVELPRNSKSAVNTPVTARPLSPLKPKSAKAEEKRRSASARAPISPTGKHKGGTLEDDKKKRSVSEAVKGTALRGKNNKGLSKKRQTSAFVEGIRNITVEEATMDADCSGWMSKKGSGTMGTWKTRFFTLHGTRLSYFASTSDTRERGLIDITAHCVVPAKEDDKLVSLYAASTGKGRFCFKLIPPHPGSKKGLTFTQPRVHYFAVDSREDMRAWMAALIKTTIDIDTSVPVISSCTTTTVSLDKAQEMLSKAREETRLKEQQYLNEEDEDQLLWEREQQGNKDNNEEEAPESATTNPSSNGSTAMSSNGFASPYLLASGVLSPNLHRSGTGKSGKFRENTPERARQMEAHAGVERN